MPPIPASITSDEALHLLKTYFTADTSEMQRMNRVTNHYRKCVMTLQSSDSERGSTSWFSQMWQSLLRSDKAAFQSHIERKYLLKEGDFYVDFFIQSQCECPVIFYLFSVLDPLVQRTFRYRVTVNPHSNFPEPESTWHQALNVLHNPSLGHNEYRAFIGEAHDAPENRGNPLLMMPLTATANLSALSTLLAQLRSEEVAPVTPPFYIWKIQAIDKTGEREFNRYNGFVVVAQTEAAARAQCIPGDEGLDDPSYWNNPDRSTCEKIGLSNTQANCVVLYDHYAA